MDCYIFRLKRLGFSLEEAFKIYDEFMCHDMVSELDEYITELEDASIVE